MVDNIKAILLLGEDKNGLINTVEIRVVIDNEDARRPTYKSFIPSSYLAKEGTVVIIILFTALADKVDIIIIIII